MTEVAHYLLRVSHDKKTGKPRFSLRDTATGALRYFKSSEELAKFVEQSNPAPLPVTKEEGKSS